MRKKLAVGVVGVGAAIVGWVGFAAQGSSAQALSCPSALGGACGVVNPVISTLCYQPLPQVGTIDFITIQTNGRPLPCPDL